MFIIREAMKKRNMDEGGKLFSKTYKLSTLRANLVKNSNMRERVVDGSRRKFYLRGFRGNLVPGPFLKRLQDSFLTTFSSDKSLVSSKASRMDMKAFEYVFTGLRLELFLVRDRSLARKVADDFIKKHVDTDFAKMMKIKEKNDYQAVGDKLPYSLGGYYRSTSSKRKETKKAAKTKKTKQKETKKKKTKETKKKERSRKGGAPTVSAKLHEKGYRKRGTDNKMYYVNNGHRWSKVSSKG
jgi:hypothetical protein